MRFGEQGYTGGLLERELLGKAEKAHYNYSESKYLTLKDAMEIAKNIQPEGSDPSDPETRFANDLHATVADELGIEDYSKLRFYTAVGTPLDRYKGVDAFFELDHKGRTLFVTLDVTSNPNKTSHKADIVFYVSREGIDPAVDREEYDNVVKNTANSVVERFRSLINRKSH